ADYCIKVYDLYLRNWKIEKGLLQLGEWDESHLEVAAVSSGMKGVAGTDLD
ncbi:hypothetical protein FCV25MIE_09243, partial [Fagus crenata]